MTDVPEEIDASLNARFEDVTDAVLKLEVEEDASAGFDDLPELVKSASAVFASGDTDDEADTIAALALAMEEESDVEHAAPPAPSDIRSLMLRVEALAKKAEAMRLAQSDVMETTQGGERRSKPGRLERSGASLRYRREKIRRRRLTGSPTFPHGIEPVRQGPLPLPPRSDLKNA